MSAPTHTTTTELGVDGVPSQQATPSAAAGLFAGQMLDVLTPACSPS